MPLAPPAVGAWLAQTLELAAKLVRCRSSVLLLDDPRRAQQPPKATVVAAFGDEAAAWVGAEVPLDRGRIGATYRERTILGAVPSTSAFDPEIDRQFASSPEAMVAAPLVFERTVAGVLLLLDGPAQDAFSAHDVTLVGLIADYLSRSLLNAVDVLKQNELVLSDELTRVGNFRGLEVELPRRIEEATRSDRDLSVLFVDIDRLKRVNDRLGHRAGSEAIRRTARALEATLDGRGAAFRFGGDEFVILLPGAELGDAVATAEELRRSVAAGTAGPLSGGGELGELSISVGAASLRGSLAGPEEGGGRSSQRPATHTPSARLLAAADKALYRAKRAGRNRVARASRRDDPARRRTSTP